MTAIPFKKPAPVEPKCSFCTTVKKQCKVLIGGNGVYICDKCIKACQQRLKETE